MEILRKTRITGLAMVLTLSLACSHTKPGDDQAAQPNIIFILADDMGSGDIQALNAGSKMSTISHTEMRSYTIHCPASLPFASENGNTLIAEAPEAGRPKAKKMTPKHSFTI